MPRGPWYPGCTETRTLAAPLLIFRLSGTGSAGATIRMYVEQYEADASKHSRGAQDAFKPLLEAALEALKLEEFTGRKEPTVIT